MDGIKNGNMTIRERCILVKLEGVKVIDMKDGEVTKITYEGAEFVKIGREEKQTPKFNVGDYAKVVGGTRFGDIDEGTYVKIAGDDGYEYEVELLDGSDYDYADPESLEKVELSDDDLAFIKIGREPGEFKKGDIVRFTECTGAHDYPEGSITEIKSDVIDGSFEFGIGYAGRTEWVELVAPAESRLDING